MTHEEAMTRAKELVAKMTTEEAASQLCYIAPAIDRLGIPAYNWWNEALHGVARAGTATVFPQAIGLAAMFDRKMQRKVGETVSTEGRAKYNAQSREGDRDIYKGLTFWSPNINIFRDPRWGRGQETYGEDPYLTGTLGVEFVKGVQGDGKYLKAAACAKHWCIHSGPEGIRHGYNAVASKKDKAETYFPAFKRLIQESDVEAVMSAYNAIDGIPASAHGELLNGLLRKEWGFKGHVVSDCWAISDIHQFHHYTDTAPESAAVSIKAGCDLNCGVAYLHLMQALQDGLVDENDIRTACERVMATRYRLGLFADDCEYDRIGYEENDTEEHAALALKAAQEAMVLLKNDGILPLDPDKLKSVAVIGPNATSEIALYGNYNGTSSRFTTFLEGIRKALEGKARVYYSQGCHLYKDRTDGLSQAKDRLSEAVACTKAADVAILCLGIDSTIEGEQGDTGNAFAAGDKTDLNLPESQLLLLDAVLAAGKPVVIVLASGSALSVNCGNAVIEAWYPGQAGGEALADILFGKVSPSGKLPVTFYRSADDLPDFTDYSMKNRTYRYFTGEALYPFGFGLTYTDFTYSNAKFENGAVTVTVKNTGSREADEVIQVYIKDLESEFAAVNYSLCGYDRVTLKPGEEQTVTLPIEELAFMCSDENGEIAKRSGRFRFYVGGSQPDAVSVKLTGRKPLEIEMNR